MANASGLLICKEAIIPVANLLYIEKCKYGGYVAVVGKNGATDTTNISNDAYNKIMESVLDRSKHEDEIKRLKKRIQLLEQHISLMPGGTEYLLIEQDFEQNAEKQNMNQDHGSQKN